MHHHDEPILDGSVEDRHLKSSDASYVSVQESIATLLAKHRYGVLCTQGDTQPYGSLVAFAFSEDLSSIAFCTPISTRKYVLLKGCERVAFVIDSRASHPENLMEVDAVTATGRATEIPPGVELDVWSQRLIGRQPTLRSFVESPSSALFRIAIARYFHVARFQEVMQWTPPGAG